MIKDAMDLLFLRLINRRYQYKRIEETYYLLIEADRITCDAVANI
jgi:hypothetical protein